MKKKILSIVLVLFLMMGMILGLTACEKDDDEEEKVESSPEQVVEDYIKAINEANVEKMIKLTDPYGNYVFNKLDDYEEFWDEYKVFIKDKDDEYEDVKYEYEESLEKDNLEDAEDTLEDIMEDKTIKLKEIKNVKELGKNFYRVKAKIEEKYDGNIDISTVTFYVMKNGLNYYLVGGIY